MAPQERQFRDVRCRRKREAFAARQTESNDRVVVRVILFSAPLALELVSVTGLVPNTSALVASFARVLRAHCVHENTPFFSFVLDKLCEFAERLL